MCLPILLSDCIIMFSNYLIYFIQTDPHIFYIQTEAHGWSNFYKFFYINKAVLVSVEYFESISIIRSSFIWTTHPSTHLISPSVSVMLPYLSQTYLEIFYKYKLFNFCFINSRNSGNSIVPLPSRSASIIRFRTSSSDRGGIKLSISLI